MSRPLLYVVSSLGPGGAERQLVYLVTALRQEGHDVAVAVWNFREVEVNVAPLRACGARVLPIEGASRVAKIRSLRNIIREGRYAVVCSATFYLNVVIQMAAAGTGALAVGAVRSTLAQAFSDSGPVLARLSARWPRRQVYNNEFAAAEIQRRKWWRPARVEVLPNYIDVASMTHADIPVGTPNIAAIGSLLPVKRWERLIEAARCLRSRGRDFAAAIAGDGPLRESLQKQIDDTGLTDRVTLRGYVADVKRFLAESAFLMHVSESEGSPNVIIEAMAAGRAVVATDVGDTARLVRDGETGFVVPSGDAQALCDRAELLLADRERCVAMGLRAREVALSRFSARSLVDETLQVYRRLGWS